MKQAQDQENEASSRSGKCECHVTSFIVTFVEGCKQYAHGGENHIVCIPNEQNTTEIRRVKRDLRRKRVLLNLNKKNSDMICLVQVGDSEELDLSTTCNTRWRTRVVVQLHRKL